MNSREMGVFFLFGFWFLFLFSGGRADRKSSIFISDHARWDGEGDA